MNTKIFLIAGTQDARKLAQLLLTQKFQRNCRVVSKFNDKKLERDDLERILRYE